ncbi:MAG: glycosyltransferase family 2 protein [Vicinamibacterales bacterium]
MKLSVIMPAYNRQATIREIVSRVLAVDLGTSKGARHRRRRLEGRHARHSQGLDGHNGVRALPARQPGQGRGRGRGIEGIHRRPRDHRDADLEYDPREYPQLIQPILDGHAEVVYGSRFLGSPRGHRVLYFWHSVGNKMLTMLSNMFSDLNLTDMETCYKVFVRDVAVRLDIQMRDFGIEPEITQKIARMRARVYRCPSPITGARTKKARRSG